MIAWVMLFTVIHQDGTSRSAELPIQSAGATEDSIIELMNDDLAETIIVTLCKRRV